MGLILALLFPTFATVTQRLIIAVALAGFMLALTKALEAVQSGNVFERLRGLRDTHRIISQVLPVLAPDDTGEDPYTVAEQQRVNLAVDTVIRTDQELAVLQATYFETVLEVMGARDQLLAILEGFYYTRSTFAAVLQHLDVETARINSGITVRGAMEALAEMEYLVSRPPLASLDEVNIYETRVHDAVAQGWLTQDVADLLLEYAATVAMALTLPTVVPPRPVPVPVPPPPFPVPVGVSPDMAALIMALQGQMAYQVQIGQATLAQLEAMNARIADVAVGVAAPTKGTFELPGVTPILGGLLGALTGTGVGSLAGSFTTALTNTAPGRAHAAQGARFQSSGTWAAELLRYLGMALPSLAGGAGLFFQTTLGPQIQAMAEEAFSSLADIPGTTSENLEANATANAAARFRQALLMGTKAQLLSYSLEALGSVKYMGFNQIAGLIGEFAGFGRIAGGVMGTVENAAIYQPLRWKANRQFRPTLPDERQLALMYQKRSLTRPELNDFQERLGLPPLYIDRLPGFIFNDPNPSLMIRAFQIAEPGAVTFSADDRQVMAIANISPDDPDAYIKLKLAKGGLDDLDVQAFLPVVKMGILRREQTIWFDAINRLYRDGYISTERARQEIEEARAPAPTVDYRLAAMSRLRDYEEKQDILGLVTAAYGKGLLSDAQAQEALDEIGMDAARARVHLLRTKVGLTPLRRGIAENVTPAAVTETPEEEGA